MRPITLRNEVATQQRQRLNYRATTSGVSRGHLCRTELGSSTVLSDSSVAILFHITFVCFPPAIIVLSNSILKVKRVNAKACNGSFQTNVVVTVSGVALGSASELTSAISRLRL
jgi:hypothetical protein